MSTISEKCSKKTLQAISKAQYHLQSINSAQKQVDSNSQQNKNQLKCFDGLKFMKHFIIKQEFQGQKILNDHVLVDSIKKLYLTSNASKIKQNIFLKTHSLRSSYLPIYQQFNQAIDIYLIERQANLSYQVQDKKKQSYIKIIQKPSLQQKKAKQKQYTVYVIHHCNFNSQQNQEPLLKWENFVQKYEFKKQFDEAKKEFVYKIKYCMIFSHVLKSCSSLFFKFNQSSNVVKNFLHYYFDQNHGNQQQIKKLQSYIFQSQKFIQQKQQQLDQQLKKMPCYSSQLKRQKLIPAQHFMGYKKLKEQLYKIYSQANKQYIAKRQIKDPEMKFQNTVCKFMIDNDFDIKKSRERILEFIKWQHQLRTKYSMKYFQKYVDMDIMTELGTDRMGRPVVLFKTYNFFVDKVPDVQEYCKFFFYFLIIYQMSKTKGYIDDIIIIGDARNNTSRNFKLDVNKQIAIKGTTILPRHFFKIVIFGNNTLSFYIYQIVKPWLPAYAEEGLKMYKDDFEQVRQFLLQFMDNQIIPQVLGGQNSKCNDLSKSEMTTRRQIDESLPSGKAKLL